MTCKLFLFYLNRTNCIAGCCVRRKRVLEQKSNMTETNVVMDVCVCVAVVVVEAKRFYIEICRNDFS